MAQRWIHQVSKSEQQLLWSFLLFKAVQGTERLGEIWRSSWVFLHSQPKNVRPPYPSMLCCQGLAARVREELWGWKVGLFYWDRHRPLFTKSWAFLIYWGFVIMVIFKHRETVQEPEVSSRESTVNWALGFHSTNCYGRRSPPGSVIQQRTEKGLRWDCIFSKV